MQMRIAPYAEQILIAARYNYLASEIVERRRHGAGSRAGIGWRLLGPVQTITKTPNRRLSRYRKAENRYSCEKDGPHERTRIGK